MARPVNVLTFGRAHVDVPPAWDTDWSGLPSGQYDFYDFTDVLQDYTLPNVRLTPVRIGSSRANYPIRGMLEDMVASLTLTGHTPAIIGSVGAYLQFEFEAEIEDDGRTGVGFGGDAERDARELVARVRGWCNGYDPGQVQGPYSQPQTATVELQVVAYRIGVPALGPILGRLGDADIPAVYDIDLDIDKYLRHGVSLWRAAG